MTTMPSQKFDQRVRRRRLLTAFAFGTLAGVSAWLAPWIYFKAHSIRMEYVLQYNRNTTPPVWRTNVLKDPGLQHGHMTDYLVEIAMSCKIPAWRIGGNEGTSTDMDFSSWLHFDVDSIDQDRFNCVSKFVIPPYVTLRQQSRLEDGLLAFKQAGPK